MMEAVMEEEAAKHGNRKGEAVFKDIRRYYCQYCGICRSKKTLISSHILSHHKEEMNKEGEVNPEKMNSSDNKMTCEECGVSFQKPAHLRQHMQSHSLERPFPCPVDDCQSSYRRKDHLARHLLQHQGKLFECPFENCKIRFAFQGNMTRHVREFHDESFPSDVHEPKDYVCKEIGCGKVFKYPSKLRKHEDSHVKLEAVEAFCSEPGCMRYFSNENCLKEHIRTCHQYINCEICGTKQLKKNIKRHLCTHEAGVSTSKFMCSFEGCSRTFSTKSNLSQHVKAVHYELKPFSCGFLGCGMKFPFKHVRDNHEKSGCHIFTRGDFEEADEQFHSMPRGGRKRNFSFIETLTRKRVVPPSESDSIVSNGSEYLSWLMSEGTEDRV